MIVWCVGNQNGNFQPGWPMTVRLSVWQTIEKLSLYDLHLHRLIIKKIQELVRYRPLNITKTLIQLGNTTFINGNFMSHVQNGKHNTESRKQIQKIQTCKNTHILISWNIRDEKKLQVEIQGSNYITSQWRFIRLSGRNFSKGVFHLRLEGSWLLQFALDS